MRSWHGAYAAVHDTPQPNGIAERLARTLLERFHAFAHGSGLLKSWDEALRHALLQPDCMTQDGKMRIFKCPFMCCSDDCRTC
jgi:hypothetical protein